jgi:hypothetical protein
VTVHVGELHTDVVPSGQQSTPPARGDQHRPPGSAEETWAQLRCLGKALERRTRAEGFDD